MKKIAVISGTRAEFGLLRPLLDELEKKDHVETQLIVTAMHLSPEFGNTIEEIEEQGYHVSKKVECLVSSDTAVGVTKSMGLAMIGFADAYEELKPDLVVVLGDRTELLAAASAATAANIPIAHIHGGETTEGAYDESIRHAITKMSYFHFPSAEIYKNRIIQLGEHPDRIFNVGALCISSMNSLPLMNKEDFEQSINFKLGKKNILVTFHPVTLERNSSEKHFNAILRAVDSLEDVRIIFTHANSDKNGRIINEMIENFVEQNSHRATSFKSLGQLRYFSALKHVQAVVGNSSSGIIEVPYFHIPTINIGDRQKGRIAPESVLHTDATQESIEEAFAKAFDNKFREMIKNQEQLFGKGEAAEEIANILLNNPVRNLKKEFYDLKF